MDAHSNSTLIYSFDLSNPSSFAHYLLNLGFGLYWYLYTHKYFGLNKTPSLTHVRSVYLIRYKIVVTRTRVKTYQPMRAKRPTLARKMCVECGCFLFGLLPSFHNPTQPASAAAGRKAKDLSDQVYRKSV